MAGRNTASYFLMHCVMSSLFGKRAASRIACRMSPYGQRLRIAPTKIGTVPIPLTMHCPALMSSKSAGDDVTAQKRCNRNLSEYASDSAQWGKSRSSANKWEKSKFKFTGFTRLEYMQKCLIASIWGLFSFFKNVDQR